MRSRCCILIAIHRQSIHVLISFSPEARKVLIIITDGRSNSGMVSGPAERLKNSGVVVFALGTGQDVSLPELYTIASEPKQKYVAQLTDLSQHLVTLVKQWSNEICKGKCETDNLLKILRRKRLHDLTGGKNTLNLPFKVFLGARITLCFTIILSTVLYSHDNNVAKAFGSANNVSND